MSVRGGRTPIVMKDGQPPLSGAGGLALVTVASGVSLLRDAGRVAAIGLASTWHPSRT
jgi:hypothetical protein